jgi:hypothetical protein
MSSCKNIQPSSSKQQSYQPFLNPTSTFSINTLKAHQNLAKPEKTTLEVVQPPGEGTS